MESFAIVLISDATAQLFPDITLMFFTTFFIGATESGKRMGGFDFGNVLPLKLPKPHRGKFYVNWLKKTSKDVKNLLYGTCFLPFHYG